MAHTRHEVHVADHRPVPAADWTMYVYLILPNQQAVCAEHLLREAQPGTPCEMSLCKGVVQ